MSFSRCSHRPCGRLAPWLTLLLLLAVGGASPASAVPAPIVIAIAPDAASPGDTVTLSGENLQEAGKESYAWIRTAGGGFVLEQLSATAEGDLAATVGAVASTNTGTVELWRGRAHDVPPRTLWVGGRLVSAFDSRVFVAHEVSLHGPSFSPLTTSVGTLEVPPASGSFSIDLDSLFPIDPVKPLRVKAVIETGGATGDGGSGGSGGSGGGGNLIHVPLESAITRAAMTGTSPRWALHVIVEPDRAFNADSGGSSREVAAALAAVLTQQFGSLGLHATADGSRLVISSQGGIEGGFVTISPYCPAQVAAP